MLMQTESGRGEAEVLTVSFGMSQKIWGIPGFHDARSNHHTIGDVSPACLACLTNSQTTSKSSICRNRLNSDSACWAQSLQLRAVTPEILVKTNAMVNYRNEREKGYDGYDVCELTATFSSRIARPVEHIDADGRSAGPDSRRWTTSAGYALDKIANR